jgi:hypothetical protein
MVIVMTRALCKYKLSIELVLQYVNLLPVDGASLVMGQRNGHRSGLALLAMTVTIRYSLIPRLELSRCDRYSSAWPPRTC